jgi:hypothetical protein
MKRNFPKDSQGFDIVKISKSKSTLGLAFEGGIDTDQKIPRIINVNADGAAAENGDLRVGQLIREVDGRNVEGNIFLYLSDRCSSFHYNLHKFRSENFDCEGGGSWNGGGLNCISRIFDFFDFCFLFGIL